MRYVRDNVRLYAVTDPDLCAEESLLAQVEKALRGGATMVQLRDKNADREKMLRDAVDLAKLCHAYGVPLIVNDDADIAVRSGADGVHVGQSDMEAAEARRRIGPDMILGVTAKTVEQALKAQAAGADYIGSGAVFGSATKLDAKPMSNELLKEICSAVDIPVTAIGGINGGNISRLWGTGISGVAVVSGIFAADDITEECRSLLKKSDMVSGRRLPSVLTIAGSDSSGGAGIQADIKTMTANGVYAMSAITALTAQNTKGVTGICEVTPDFLAAQLDAVFNDIYPDAVKTGMMPSAALIEVTADRLRGHNARNVVVDPVMVATSGSRLMAEEALSALIGKLLPLAAVVTPNIPEAEVLAGINISSESDMEHAAHIIHEKCGCGVLMKGGHGLSGANDYFWDGIRGMWFRGKRIDNENTHGTGCTLSSAIASNLAKGYSLECAVRTAKEYISDCLSAMLDMGAGSGPMNHMNALRGRFMMFKDDI